MDEFVTLDSVFAGHIFSHFEQLFHQKECIYVLENCNGYDELATGLRVVQFRL